MASNWAVVCTGLELRLGVFAVNTARYSVTETINSGERKVCNPVCADMVREKQEAQEEAGSPLLQRGRAS